MKQMIWATNLVREDGKSNSILPSLVTTTTNGYVCFFHKCCIESLVHLP